MLASNSLFAGRYRIRSAAAAQSAITSYRAIDLRTAAEVVLTLPHPQMLRDASYLRQVRRQMSDFLTVHSNDIARRLEAAEHAGTPYAVEEYVPGETVAERVKARGKLPAADALQLGLVVARALETADDRDLMHGRLTPSLIRIDGARVKVSGFGWPWPAGRQALAAAHALSDDAPYRAPEQAIGAGDIRSDIYALGAMLFETLIGHVPLDAAALSQQGRLLRESAGLSGNVVTLLERTLAQHPAGRPRTPAEMIPVFEREVRRLELRRSSGGTTPASVRAEADEDIGGRTATHTVPRSDLPAPSRQIPAPEPSTAPFPYAGRQPALPGAGPPSSPAATAPVTGRSATSRRPRPAHRPGWAFALVALVAALATGTMLRVHWSSSSTDAGDFGLLDDRVRRPIGAPMPSTFATPARMAAGPTPTAIRSGEAAPLVFQSVVFGQWHLALVDGLGGAVHTVPRLGDWDDGEPSFSPDGAEIVFVSNRDGRFHLYIMRPDGRELRQLTRGDFDDHSPVWSPDGSLIAFSSNRDQGQEQVYVVPVAGGEARQQTHGPGGGAQPAWSPDGTYLALTRRPGTAIPVGVSGDGSRFTLVREGDAAAAPQIFVVDTRGGVPRQITSGSQRLADPSWSPDGAWIAYSAAAEDRSDIYLVDTGGTTVRRLTSAGANHHPTWSPDGRQIALSAGQGDETAIVAITLETSSVRHITGGTWPAVHPSWPRR